MRWNEVAITAMNEMEKIAGTGVFGPGIMSDNQVVATQVSNGWLVEYKNSQGRCRKRYLLKPGRTYRVTREKVRRVCPAAAEADPIVRMVRILGFSPNLIVRHESGEKTEISDYLREVYRHRGIPSELAYKYSHRWAANFPILWGGRETKVSDGRLTEETSQSATVIWADGMVAIKQPKHGNSFGPEFHVCGTPEWSDLRKFVLKVWPEEKI